MPKYLFLLTITDAESDDYVGMIDSMSLESLEEKLKNVPTMIENYEQKQKELEDYQYEE